jgi:hypothetical protein
MNYKQVCFCQSLLNTELLPLSKVPFSPKITVLVLAQNFGTHRSGIVSIAKCATGRRVYQRRSYQALPTKATKEFEEG